MSDLRETLSIAASGMRAQGTRLRHVAENIANADTPGYRRKLVPFQEVEASQGGGSAVVAGRIQLDQSDLKQIYDPSHPLAGEDGRYEGSNVNTVLEVADSREAQRSYEANLRMFDQARKMSSALLGLLRQ